MTKEVMVALFALGVCQLALAAYVVSRIADIRMEFYKEKAEVWRVIGLVCKELNIRYNPNK